MCPLEYAVHQMICLFLRFFEFEAHIYAIIAAEEVAEGAEGIVVHSTGHLVEQVYKAGGIECEIEGIARLCGIGCNLAKVYTAKSAEVEHQHIVLVLLYLTLKLHQSEFESEIMLGIHHKGCPVETQTTVMRFELTFESRCRSCAADVLKRIVRLKTYSRRYVVPSALKVVDREIVVGYCIVDKSPQRTECSGTLILVAVALAGVCAPATQGVAELAKNIAGVLLGSKCCNGAE